jgi:hypothetical protein
MDLQAEKLKLIEWLKSLTDQTVIENLKLFKENFSASKDWWETISDSEKQSIDRGLTDIKNNRTQSHSDVMKKYGRPS